MVESYCADNGTLLATVVRRGPRPDGATFFTDPSCQIQVGEVSYRAGGQIAPHDHNPIPRKSLGTVEVLVVLEGGVRMTLWTDGCNFRVFDLAAGDMVIIQPGAGHGLEMLGDTRLLEVKSGPYVDRETDKTFLEK